jgi:hypothetical protein
LDTFSLKISDKRYIKKTGIFIYFYSEKIAITEPKKVPTKKGKEM